MAPSHFLSPGNQLKVIAAIHNSLVLVLPKFRTRLYDIWSHGFSGSQSRNVRIDMERMGVEWFIVTGNLLFAFGMLLNAYEKETQKPLPRSIAYVLLGTAAVGWYFRPLAGKLSLSFLPLAL